MKQRRIFAMFRGVETLSGMGWILTSPVLFPVHTGSLAFPRGGSLTASQMCANKSLAGFGLTVGGGFPLWTAEGSRTMEETFSVVGLNSCRDTVVSEGLLEASLALPMAMPSARGVCCPHEMGARIDSRTPEPVCRCVLYLQACSRHTDTHTNSSGSPFF